MVDYQCVLSYSIVCKFTMGGWSLATRARFREIEDVALSILTGAKRFPTQKSFIDTVVSVVSCPLGTAKTVVKRLIDQGLARLEFGEGNGLAMAVCLVEKEGVSIPVLGGFATSFRGTNFEEDLPRRLQKAEARVGTLEEELEEAKNNFKAELTKVKMQIARLGEGLYKGKDMVIPSSSIVASSVRPDLEKSASVGLD